MTSRKRNEWLDADLSGEEDDDAGYNSEDQEESRGARSIKRRRVNQDSDDESMPDEEDDDDLDKSQAIKPTPAKGVSDDIVGGGEDEEEEEEEEEEDAEDDNDIAPETKVREKTVKPLTAKQLARSQKAAKKTGVIYISRVPPFMKPATLKHFLSPYGEIGRVFLTPEDSVQHAQRVRAGGNKKKSFTDGWVEFVNKKNAKIVAESLNGNTIGGKKGSFYHDDIWNIKYLTGFKWTHLTEQIANENAERAARLRAEISKTRRENKAFVEDVERSKMLEGMRTKKAAQRERKGEAPVPDKAQDLGLRRQQFKQNQIKTKEGPKTEQPDDVKRVLSKIF